MLRDRCALPTEEGNLLRWFEEFPKQLAEGGCGKHRRKKDVDKKAREEGSRSGKREVEREKKKTVVKRRCV